MLIDDLYLSLPILVCFDGDGGEGDPGAGGEGDPGAEREGDPSAGGEATPKTFTQEQVNKILAEDKRKHKAQLEKTERQLQELLESKNLSEAERAKAEEAREDILKQLRTKEEQAKIDKKKLETEYEARLAQAEKRATEAEQKYERSTVERALTDAAIEADAFNPSVLVTYLRGDTKIDANGKVMVNVPMTLEDGTIEPGLMTPAEAIKKMKEDPERFGGLFKSNVVSGVGGSSGTGTGTGKNVKIDVTKLSTAEYMRLRKEAPEKLGLK